MVALGAGYASELYSHHVGQGFRLYSWGRYPRMRWRGVLWQQAQDFLVVHAFSSVEEQSPRGCIGEVSQDIVHGGSNSADAVSVVDAFVPQNAGYQF